ncbi:MAG: hypothetical protein U1F35_09655 [Steroidobacteraceae bacterium]
MLSDAARVVGQRIKGLRDFLALLESNGQLVRWTDPVMPEPDIRTFQWRQDGIRKTDPP